MTPRSRVSYVRRFYSLSWKALLPVMTLDSNRSSVPLAPGVVEAEATLRTTISGYSGTPPKWPQRREALLALDSLLAYIKQLEGERDALRLALQGSHMVREGDNEYLIERAEAAKARLEAVSRENERLREIGHELLAAYDEEEDEHGFPFNFRLRDAHRALRRALAVRTEEQG
jgi:hypothetical protein